MTSVTTKTGDAGTSGLMYGARASKTHQRFAALGAVDELMTALGMAKVASTDAVLKGSLEAVQKQIVALSMELATLPVDFQKARPQLLPEEAVEELHAQIKQLEAQGAVFKGFELPGKSALDAVLHQARAVCRRAEREVWGLHEETPLARPLPPMYLNRLSDLLWVWALYYQV